jgi:hypothetical protein
VAEHTLRARKEPHQKPETMTQPVREDFETDQDYDIALKQWDEWYSDRFDDGPNDD